MRILRGRDTVDAFARLKNTIQIAFSKKKHTCMKKIIALTLPVSGSVDFHCSPGNITSGRQLTTEWAHLTAWTRLPPQRGNRRKSLFHRCFGLSPTSFCTCPSYSSSLTSTWWLYSSTFPTSRPVIVYDNQLVTCLKLRLQPFSSWQLKY